MYYIGIFALSTGLVLNFYDYMRHVVHLWLTYGLFMAHLVKLVQSGEAYLSEPFQTHIVQNLIHRGAHYFLEPSRASQGLEYWLKSFLSGLKITKEKVT